MKLQELASALLITHIHGDTDTEITGIEADSRKIKHRGFVSVYPWTNSRWSRLCPKSDCAWGFCACNRKSAGVA